MSQLSELITSEITGDEFFEALRNLTKKDDVNIVLEIGSYSGRGSTKALIEGLASKEGMANISLFAIEVSKERHLELSSYYKNVSFVHCFHGSSVGLDEFPSQEEVAWFYDNISCGLQRFQREEVLGWLQQDVEYVREQGSGENDAITRIKEKNNIDIFDLVLIDGSEFTGTAELGKVIGAKYIALDNTNTYKCYAARKILLEHPCYQLIADNQCLRNGYSVFKLCSAPYGSENAINWTLPEIHFFTIVLNGMPYVKEHIDIFSNLPIKWHWHVVEGVAELTGDTAWSVNNGGKIPDTFHDKGLSVDGTTQYLDDIQQRFSDRVTIYRKGESAFWKGKKEMVSAPIENLPGECILWQIDSDEIWNEKQIITLWRSFILDSARSAAWFWCNYFVGEDRYVSSRNCYSQNPDQEWLRVWKFRSGDSWHSHEPPTLTRTLGGETFNVGLINPFTHSETEKLGLVFNHYAYCQASQIKFKEDYYGYTHAFAQWQQLQNASLPCKLSEYFDWVKDDTIVNSIENITGLDDTKESLCKIQYRETSYSSSGQMRIAIDCVAWQLLSGGICRYWSDIFEQWSQAGFSNQILLIDRDNTSPAFNGFDRVSINKFDFARLIDDAETIEEVCIKNGCSLFLSTYYTLSLSIPSYFIGHDMIPEVIGADVSSGSYLLKQLAILHSSRQACVSANSQRDLIRYYPDASLNLLSSPVYPCVSPIFTVGTNNSCGYEDRSSFPQTTAGTNLADKNQPFVLYVGTRVGLEGIYGGYKNAISLAKAIGQLNKSFQLKIVFVGGSPKLEDEISSVLPAGTYSHITANDEELKALYKSALCIVVPSYYEGFGIPIIEAQSCGCVVICSKNSSLEEAAGTGALFLEHPTPTCIAYAIRRLILNQTCKNELVAKGYENARRFQSNHSADLLRNDLIKLLNDSSNANNTRSTWNHFLGISALVLAPPSPPSEHNRSSILRTKRISFQKPILLPSPIEISIITPTYNSGGTIRPFLESVASQVDVTAELIIIDNCSIDDTLAIARDYCSFCGILSEPDNGIYAAMNKGIRLASGNYFLFMGADDKICSTTALSDALRLINVYPGYDIYYGDLVVSSDGKECVHRPYPGSIALRELILGCLPHQSMLIPRDTFNKIGNYREEYYIHGDYEWMLRALTTTGIRAKKIDVKIGNFRTGGLSTLRFSQGQSEVLKIQNENILFNTSYWLEQRANKSFEALVRYRLSNH